MRGALRGGDALGDAALEMAASVLDEHSSSTSVPRRASSAGGFTSHLAAQLGVSEPSGASSSSDVDSVDDERRTGIYNFLQVPWNLEPLLMLGYVMCLDCFLQLVTFLPLRVLGALINKGGTCLR